MDELLDIIEELIQQSQDNFYEAWYNRDTMTDWTDSYEYSRYIALGNKLSAIQAKYSKVIDTSSFSK